MRGGERKAGPPNKERGDGVCDGSLQSHSGVNLHPKRAKNRGNVANDGEANGVALTMTEMMNLTPTLKQLTKELTPTQMQWWTVLVGWLQHWRGWPIMPQVESVSLKSPTLGP
jgi:hypothetical protein